MKPLVTAVKIAWRNRRRNALTFAAMTASTAALIIACGLMGGSMTGMERAATDVTDLSFGEVQVHREGYLSERSLYATIEEPAAILDAARAAGIAAAPRAFGSGLLSVGSKSAGAVIWGLLPAAEIAVNDLPKNLLKGAFLGDRPRHHVVLGRKLARALEADLGTELVVVVHASDGSLGNALFTVVGVQESVGEAFDRSAALIHRDDFANLFVFAGKYHEITLSSRGARRASDVAASVTPSAGENEVRTWQELLPAAGHGTRTAMDASIALLLAVLLLAVGFAVHKTMLMATFERGPELGLMKALGATQWRVLREIIVEATLLGIASSLFGGAIGSGGAYYLSGVTMSASWRAEFSPAIVCGPIIAMWGISFFAALYPAFKAARVDPIRAFRHT